MQCSFQNVKQKKKKDEENIIQDEFNKAKQTFECDPTVEPWYNEPPYNEVLSITHDLVYPSNSKIYGNVPRYNETSL